MPDEITTDVTAASPAPTTDSGAVSSTATDIAPSSLENVQAQGAASDATQQAGSVAPPSEDEALKDLPSLDELRQQAEQKLPYAEGLLRVRTAYEALKSEHEPLKTTFEPWRSLTEKYSDVADVQSNLELLDALASPVLENGQPVLDEHRLPVTTAVPFIDKLAETSPVRAEELIRAAMSYKMQDANGTIDTAVNWHLRELGIDPKDVDQYKAWKVQGAPVAESVDLTAIPAKYHEVFKQLPAYIQKDRMDMPEEARNWQLEQDFNTHQTRQAQERYQQQAQQRVEQDISTATDKAIDGKFQEGFNQFLQHVSSWQPTADPNVNSVYHIEVASTLVNLLDARMNFANQMLMEKAGISPDPEIQQLNESYQRNEGLANRYQAFNAQNNGAYKVEEAKARSAADNDFLRLSTKLQGVAAKLIEYKTKVAKVEEGAQAATAIQSRPNVTGLPAGQNGNTGVNPDWYKSYVRTGT